MVGAPAANDTETGTAINGLASNNNCDETADSQAALYKEKVKFKRSVNLLTSVGLIMGTIIGAGIFVSPKGVLLNTGSKGECKKSKLSYCLLNSFIRNFKSLGTSCDY